MKPNGIEWIGDIPDDWEIKKVKRLFSYQKGKNAALLTKEYIGLHPGPYPVLSGQTENNGILGFYENYEFDLDKDSIFVTTVGAKAMSTKLVNKKFSLSQNCALLHKTDEKANIRFLHYALFPMFEWQKSMISLIMQPSLRFEDLDKANLPYPPLEIQQKIADYLDEKCGEIDKTIEKQKESIEKLKAYKQSLISETVTKGLNKSTPLKPTGIDFLGDIPSHWEVKRVKYVANSFEKGNGITKDDVIFDGDIQCVRYGEIYSKYDRQCIESVSDTNIDKIKSPVHISKGDILFAGTGELIEEIGKNIVYMGDKPCLAGGDIIILKHNQNPIFLNYALNSTSSQSQKSYGKLKLKVVHISASAIGNIRIALPPITEQNNIAEFLDRKCEEIDSTINKKQNLIEKLDAYKKSLIFECVTGKRTI